MGGRRRRMYLAFPVLIVAVVASAILGANAGAGTSKVKPKKKPPAASVGCKKYNLNKPNPAGPVTIRLATSYGPEAYAGGWTFKVMPQTAHPYMGKWYNVEVDPFAANDRITAFAAGQVDAFVSSAPLSWVVASQGQPIQLVLTDLDVPKDGGADISLYVLQGSSIQRMKDLAGKKVAVLGLGSGNELSLRAGILGDGGDPNSVTPVALPGASIGPALRSGQVDAAYLVQPFLAAELQTGGIRAVGTLVGGFQVLNPKYPSYPGLEEFFNSNFLKKYPAAVCAYIHDRQKEYTIINQNMQYWRQQWLSAGFTSTSDPKGFLAAPGQNFPNDLAVNLTAEKLEASMAIKTGMIKSNQVPNWKTFVWPLATTK